MLCPKMYCKGTMKVHSWKKHKENFKWVKLGCNKVQEEVLKDHIKGHNVNAKNLLNSEHHNVSQEKRVETDHKILEFMDSRPHLFERCQISGDIIGF